MLNIVCLCNYIDDILESFYLKILLLQWEKKGPRWERNEKTWQVKQMEVGLYEIVYRMQMRHPVVYKNLVPNIWNCSYKYLGVSRKKKLVSLGKFRSKACNFLNHCIIKYSEWRPVFQIRRPVCSSSVKQHRYGDSLASRNLPELERNAACDWKLQWGSS